MFQWYIVVVLQDDVRARGFNSTAATVIQAPTQQNFEFCQPNNIMVLLDYHIYLTDLLPPLCTDRYLDLLNAASYHWYWHRGVLVEIWPRVPPTRCNETTIKANGRPSAIVTTLHKESHWTSDCRVAPIERLSLSRLFASLAEKFPHKYDV